MLRAGAATPDVLCARGRGSRGSSELGLNPWLARFWGGGLGAHSPPQGSDERMYSGGEMCRVVLCLRECLGGLMSEMLRTSLEECSSEHGLDAPCQVFQTLDSGENFLGISGHSGLQSCVFAVCSP